MLRKAIGAVSFFAGLLLIIAFPWIREYQEEKFSRAGVLLGIALVALGLYLMKT